MIVTSSSDEKLEIAKKLGAQHVINYNKTPEWSEEVMKIVSFFFALAQRLADSEEQTNGRGIDHIIEVGGPKTLAHSLKCVAYGGCIHLIGWIAGVSPYVGTITY